MPRKASRTQERILAAAKRAFAESGFAAARIENICREAEVNVRMIYAHFGSKQGLYEEVLRSAVLMERASQPVPDATDPVTQLRARLDAFLEFCDRDREYVALMLRESVDGFRTMNQIFGASDLGVPEFVELIQRGQSTGYFDKELDPFVLGAALISVSLQLFHVLLSNGVRPPADIDSLMIRNQVVSLVLHGAVARPEIRHTSQ